jgi:hypothetical protein
MQNNMEGKQTAVDYLFEMWLQDKTITQSALEQARVMFEAQIKEARSNGIKAGIKGYAINNDTYYEETYMPDPE